MTYGENARRFSGSRAGCFGGYMGKSTPAVKWTSGDRLTEGQETAEFSAVFMQLLDSKFYLLQFMVV